MGKLARKEKERAARLDRQLRKGKFEPITIGYLDKCRWYNAPVRRKKKFVQIVSLASEHPDVQRIGEERVFFNDGTSIGTDMTGRIVSTGGMSSRFKFNNQLT